ncbi:hypothetical protein K2Z84_11710 [Candidatus Binatia bacterium]|nr:hypothetical protein [Candidatus Binatia bacterium]
MIGTHTAAVAAGVLSGWYLGTRIQQQVSMLRNVGVAGLNYLQLGLLRREGGVDAYRDALLSTLALYEELGKEGDLLLSKPVLQGDSVLALARLARLEADRGRKAEAEAYVERAVQACRQIPWKSCEPNSILRLSEQMEKTELGAEAEPRPTGDS